MRARPAHSVRSFAICAVALILAAVSPRAVATADDPAGGTRMRRQPTGSATHVAFAYVAPFAIWLGLGFSAWVLLPLATLPLAARAVRAVLTHDDTASLFPWTPRTAMLGLLYAALSGAGLAVPS